MIAEKDKIFDATAYGWLYEYSLDSRHIRYAYLRKNLFIGSVRQGFTATLAHKVDLDACKAALCTPSLVSRGLRRNKLAQSKGQETDWHSGPKVINLIITPAQYHIFDRMTGKFVAHENKDAVFVVHILEAVDQSIRQKWKKEACLHHLPNGEIIGFAWLDRHPGEINLPIDYDSRYMEIMFKKGVSQ